METFIVLSVCPNISRTFVIVGMKRLVSNYKFPEVDAVLGVLKPLFIILLKRLFKW